MQSKGMAHLPHEIVPLISESLSLRELMLFCMTCKHIKPTARALALALQEAIPSCIGLPIHDKRPEFFIDIAKWYFDPKPINVSMRTDLHNAMRDAPFPSRCNMALPIYTYSDGFAFYTRQFMESMLVWFFTKKGRAAARELLLEWREFYFTTQFPGDQRYTDFIDHIVDIFDHGFVVRDRKLVPGCLQQFYPFISEFEHL